MLQGRRRTAVAARWYATQVLVVSAGITMYFRVRGLTAGSPETAHRNADDIVALERDLGIYLEPSIQELIDPHGPIATVANWIYIWGHWPVILATMIWLAGRNRAQFLRLRNAMLASGGIGLVIYATYPVAPPRLQALGMVDTITEHSQAYRWLQPPAFVNQYAAMPSLHVGWDVLVGIVVASAATGTALRVFARILPVLMVASVVVTANHYLLDVVGGLALGLTGLAVALLLERRSQLGAATAVPSHAAVPSCAAVPRPRSAADLPISAPPRTRRGR